MVQAREIITGNREGGFFLMIGKKTASSVRPESLKARV